MGVAPAAPQGPLSLTLLARPGCTACELHSQGAKSVGVPTERVSQSLEPSPHVPGLVLLGMNPGTVEDKRNRPFVGPSGEMVRKVYLAGSNSFLDISSVYLANAVRCWTPLSAQPKSKHYDACWPHTAEDLERIADNHAAPIRILCLGVQAAKAALKHLCNSKQRSFKHLLRSQGTPSSCNRYLLYFTFHPAAVLRNRPLIHAVADHLSILHDAITGKRPKPSRPILVPPRAPVP